jgi:SAM-dependent methyltransferase
MQSSKPWILRKAKSALVRTGRMMGLIKPPWESNSGAVTERWDREWVYYFLDEDIDPFLIPHQCLNLANDIRTLSAREMHKTRLTRELPNLAIYMPGDRIVNKRVFEVGCGPGLLCKQLGLVADAVVGIDHSRLALRIARYASPTNCSYYLSTEAHQQLQPQYGSFDAMVCRFFFIHQNYDNAWALLELAKKLLKPGGLVGADFYMPGPTKTNGITFPAKSRLSEQYVSSAFVYTPKEIDELAALCGFAIVDKWESPADLRRFVMLARR